MNFAPFVYGLVDPLEPKHVRYVGMAGVRASRPYDHAKWARRERAKPTWQVRWIRKLQTAGREPDVLILEQLSEGASRALLGFIEKCYIKSLREIGHHLTNVSEGGDGGTTRKGSKHRAESIDKMKGHIKSEAARALLRASWTDERRVAARERQLGNTYATGRIQPQGERDRRGQSISKYYAEHPGERVVTEGQRRKIAETLTGYKHTPEACANMGASHIGSKRTDEARSNMSRAQKGHSVSAATRVRLSAANIGKIASDETRRKQSVGVKAAKSTPEARLAASIKGKAAWALRRLKGSA